MNDCNHARYYGERTPRRTYLIMLPRHVMAASGLMEVGDMSVPHAPRPSLLQPSSLRLLQENNYKFFPYGSPGSAWSLPPPALALAARGPHQPPRPARIPAPPPVCLSPSLCLSRCCSHNSRYFVVSKNSSLFIPTREVPMGGLLHIFSFFNFLSLFLSIFFRFLLFLFCFLMSYIFSAVLRLFSRRYKLDEMKLEREIKNDPTLSIR